jgi:hypothetical protein
MYENDDTLYTLVPGAKKDRHREILDQLQQMDMDDGYIPSGNDNFEIPAPKPSDYSTNGAFLPSNFLTKKQKKKQTIYVPDQTEDEWLSALMDTHDVKIKKSKHKHNIFEDEMEGKKKKKKKEKNKNEPTDYKKEFETEAALLRNLMIDQSHFVESLQKEYDFLKSNKSSSRGINKNMTDLIANITSARSLNVQLVEKQVALKKTIADLSMKERKELSGGIGDVENLSDFASSYLKRMIEERQSILTGGSSEIGDYSINEMADILDDNLSTGENIEDRPEEVEKYLEYEDRNITIWAYVNQNDIEDYEFVALDEDDMEIADYPLPYKNKLSVNRSTNIATDTFGQKYPIRWR